MSSFAVYVLIRGEEPTCNALRFATREEAEAYGSDLLSRWTLPHGFEVRESDDMTNRGTTLHRIEEDSHR